MNSDTLKGIRAELGISQTEMAGRLGLKLRRYQYLEEGSAQIQAAQQRIALLLSMRKTQDKDLARYRQQLSFFEQGKSRFYLNRVDVTDDHVDMLKGVIRNIEDVQTYLDKQIEMEISGDTPEYVVPVGA